MTIAGHDFLIGGEVITKINGTALTSPEKIMEALRGVKVGARIAMTVYRDGNTSDVQYELPERPVLPGDLSGGAAVKTLGGGRPRKRVLQHRGEPNRTDSTMSR